MDKLPEKFKNEVSLTELSTAFSPIVEKWLQNDSLKHDREIKLAEFEIKSVSQSNKIIALGLFCVIGIVLVLSGILLFQDKYEQAMDLVKTIIGLGGAIFGGYAWGKNRKYSNQE